MHHRSNKTIYELESILFDETAEPKALPLSLLREITNDFSDKQQIGSGGFGVVYKGMLVEENVAVKRLSNTFMYEKEFQRELECLMMVRHKNIVRFLGYCADTQGSMEKYNGKFIMADVQQRLLCFEYLPMGSLDMYITDSCTFEWETRYKIIRGICQGLQYLHQQKIVHLDLKPANILLDANLMPKITDFGLSRCFHEMQSRIVTANIGGTFGYLAPEFTNGEITHRFDLYSLGIIIIEILTGKKGCHDVEDAVISWSKKLEKSQSNVQLKQVRVCAEIGRQCVNFNKADRPDTQNIIDRLDAMESMDGYIGTGVITSHQVENAPSELHQDTPMAPGETSSVDFSFSRSENFYLDQTQLAQMSQVVLSAFGKIRSILGDEATMVIIANISKKATGLKKLPGKIEQIGKQLSEMGIAIRQIGRVHPTDGIVKSWIGEVRKLAYRVEDVMDKLAYHVAMIKGGEFWKKFASKETYYVNVFIEIVDEVDEIDKQIQRVIEWLEPRKVSFPGFAGKDEDLVGIEESRYLLTDWLYSEEPESNVITVAGMGGVGKSTLVSNVYEREKMSFPAHAWIVVSQIWAVDDILRKLLRKIEYTELPLSSGIDKMGVYDLKKEIHQTLENKKCLIVLDDVWDQEVYFQIRDALQNLQSCIVITTRKDHVAGISSPNRHLELQPLSLPYAFKLFCTRAFYNRKDRLCPKELETIAISIVDMCHGLPLAIITIGSMLSSRQRLDIWKQKYDQLRGLSTDDHVLDILNLAYHDLSEDLRSCLVYCSLFPGDQPMSRDSLVRLWVAEGFVLGKEKKTPEVVAEGVLMELIHRNMLGLVEDDELGRVITFKMHNIVRDLVMSVAKEERFASANDYHTMIQMGKDVRRLSLCGLEDNTAWEVKLPHLRTVVSVGVISYSPGMLSSILSESSYLTVLELQDSEVTEVTASIGHLFNLRYIGLRHTKVKSLPDSIENLSNLLTLDIKQTKIEKLPQGIVKIKKLRHLLADRTADEKHTEFQYSIGIQAPKEISNLEELQTLETVESSNDLAEQLKKLIQLKSVWIDNISAADCANLFATLSSMPFLYSLLLSARDENEILCFEALKPMSTDLQRLIIRGQWAKGTMNCPIFLNHGTHLKYLALSWCDLDEDPLKTLAPHLPNLIFLKLNHMRCASTLAIPADSFPNLKTLVLKHMPDVSEINISDGALPRIELVYIISLLKMEKVPQGIESLCSLRKLWLLDLHKAFRSQCDTRMLLHVPELRV